SWLRPAGAAAGAASPFLTSQMMRTSGFAVWNSIRTTRDSGPRAAGRTALRGVSPTDVARVGGAGSSRGGAPGRLGARGCSGRAPGAPRLDSSAPDRGPAPRKEAEPFPSFCTSCFLLSRGSREIDAKSADPHPRRRDLTAHGGGTGTEHTGHLLARQSFEVP